jgi:electron transport complex protein RnfC
MRERAADIIEGIRIMLRALECRHAIVAIEDNKPAAHAAMSEAAKRFGQIEVSVVPSLYPMGWDKQLIGYLTGKEVPADGRSADVGVLMHNVGTAYAIQQAIRFGRPLVSRVVTVSGEAVAEPRNVEAPIGTPLADLLGFCGHQAGTTTRYIMGGPMMGDILPHPNVPLVKGATGILALTDAEIAASDAKACIRCSRCVSACPAGLLPLEMMTRIRAGQLEAAVGYGLKDCISCGSCSYACPSQIPLVHYFKYASGELASRQQAQNKTDYTKRLAQEKQARIDRHKAEQAALAAARKAAREQQKAKAEEAA